MLFDDARWNESPDPSDVENKLQDIAKDLAVFQIDRDVESDWLRNRQVCRQLDRKDSICIFHICRYASIRMGNAPEKAMGGLEGCELPDRDVPQVISTTLKASIGRCKPLSVSSPTGSAVALPSRAARTLPSIKIWPSRASEQRRAARLTTVPIAL